MTLNELRESVVSLGFESGIDKDEVLRSAVRRALHTIAVDRPTAASRSLFVLSPEGRLVSDVFLHTGGSSETFTLDGRAFSFKVMGEGYCLITDDDGEREEHFSGEASFIRGFMKGPTNITFLGEYDYVVFCLAVFKLRLTDDVSNIPTFGDRREIDLAECFPEFLSAEGMPTKKDGSPIVGAVIKGSHLSLPYSFTGEVVVFFKMKRDIPSFDSDDEVIDVPRECEEMLPLLVAFYVWLDDDADKAETYLSLYKDMLASLKRSSARVVSTAYATNGWA